MQISDKKWFVIVNPVSGGGKAPHLFKKIGAVLHNRNIQFESVETAGVLHAVALTKDAILAGTRRIMIVGGDGTANEVINGIFTSGIDTEQIIIAMISVGTGNDWVRTIGKHGSLDSIADSLLYEQTFKHDIGSVNYQKEGKMQQRYFMNIAGLGFDGYVAKKIAEGPRILQGTKLQYWMALLGSLFFYRHAEINITVDGIASAHQTLSIACGICKYNGGGMMQLPGASCEDGMLDMTLIGNMSKFKMVRSLPKLTNGSFISMKEIKMVKGKDFLFSSVQPVHVETDGEYLGETPAHIAILEKGVHVLRWS